MKQLSIIGKGYRSEEQPILHHGRPGRLLGRDGCPRGCADLIANTVDLQHHEAITALVDAGGVILWANADATHGSTTFEARDTTARTVH